MARVKRRAQLWPVNAYDRVVAAMMRRAPTTASPMVSRYGPVEHVSVRVDRRAAARPVIAYEPDDARIPRP